MIGHPGGMGPQEKWAQAWMEAYGCVTWMVRRVFDDGDDDDMTSAADVWSYRNKNLEKYDVYQNVRDGRDYAKQAYDKTVALEKKLDAIIKKLG